MDSTETKLAKPKGVRWWPAFFIVGIVGVVVGIAYLYTERIEDQTKQGFLLTGSGILTILLLLLWWLLFSRARWWQRLGVPVLIAGVAVGTLRFDGFTGKMIPIVRFNWQPLPGELLEPTVASGGDPLLANGYELKKSDWPGFRGISRDGKVVGLRFDESWLQPQELWRIPMGEGWSSFAVVGPMVWTQEQRGEQEVVVCYDAVTGGQVWSHSDSTRFWEMLGGPGPRATPTYHDGKLYALGATGILNCLDAVTGELIWSVNILIDAQAENIDWAMAGSPLIYQENVIVSAGGSKHHNVVAYDRFSGEKRWSSGKWIAAYSAPQLSTIHGVEQLLLFHGEGCTAYAPKDGSVLWNNGWTASSHINVAQPAVYNGSSVLLSAGYGRGSILLDIGYEDGKWSVEERWRSMKLKSKFNSFILDGQHVYGLDEGYLVCIELESGQRLWRGEKYGYGQLLLTGKVLLVLAESGEVIFVKADPEAPEELGRFQAIEGKTWNHPVIANGRLYVRNGKQAACFKLTDWVYGQVAPKPEYERLQLR